MSSCGSKSSTPGRQAGRDAADLDRRVGLARDHVRVGHDEPGAGDPAAALDAEPAGRADDPHDAAARRADAGRGEDAARRRGHVGGRPADRRQRVKARQRVQDRAGRWQQLVEAAQDRRALDVVRAAARAGRLRARSRR